MDVGERSAAEVLLLGLVIITSGIDGRGSFWGEKRAGFLAGSAGKGVSLPATMVDAGLLVRLELDRESSATSKSTVTPAAPILVGRS